MKYVRLSIIPLLASLFVAGFGGAPARGLHNSIAVHEAAKITGGSITLGDIATISGDLQFIVQAEGLVIGNGPYPGGERTITRNQIKARLRQRGLDPKHIALKCPDAVMIMSDCREYGEAQLQKIVVDYILSTMPWRRDQVTIQNVRCSPVQIPNVEHRYVVAVRSGDDFTGRFTATVEFYAGKTLLGKTPVSASINVMAPVIVSQRTIDRHEIISAVDVRLENREVTNLSRNFIADMDAIVGMRAKGRINQGMLMSRSMVEPAPVIKKGDIVTLYVESAALKITAPGEALQDGHLHEIIRVSNLMSNKQIYGFVSGPSMVQARY